MRSLARSRLLNRTEQHVTRKRLRIKHEKSFEQRLAEAARRYREEAGALDPGPAQNSLLMKAQQADVAAQLNERLKSPVPPK
jgi:hypothetical protein